jgi:hypothetical protein
MKNEFKLAESDPVGVPETSGLSDPSTIKVGAVSAAEVHQPVGILFLDMNQCMTPGDFFIRQGDLIGY